MNSGTSSNRFRPTDSPRKHRLELDPSCADVVSRRQLPFVSRIKQVRFRMFTIGVRPLVSHLERTGVNGLLNQMCLSAQVAFVAIVAKANLDRLTRFRLQ